MIKDTLDNWDKILELVSRGRQGFNAFCATIDLLGMRSLMKSDFLEARSRLDDLHQGFGDDLLLFPGGEDYHVCFAGDSLFIVKELSPENNWINYWPSFTGHIFAMASFLHDLDTNIGNPGLRVIISYGRLFQLREPESWKDKMISPYTKNWVVLTGASEALVKCTEAEKRGSSGGFEGRYCWHEKPDQEFKYLGTPLFKVSSKFYQQPSIYPALYEEIRRKARKRAELEK